MVPNAFHASLLIDHVDRVAQGYGFRGALRLACAARDALVRDRHRHGVSPVAESVSASNASIDLADVQDTKLMPLGRRLSLGERLPTGYGLLGGNVNHDKSHLIARRSSSRSLDRGRVIPSARSRTEVSGRWVLLLDVANVSSPGSPSRRCWCPPSPYLPSDPGSCRWRRRTHPPRSASCPATGPDCADLQSPTPTCPGTSRRERPS